MASTDQATISDYTSAWSRAWSATTPTGDEKRANWIHLPRVRTRRAFIQVILGCTLFVGAAFYLVSDTGRIEGWRVGGGAADASAPPSDPSHGRQITDLPSDPLHRWGIGTPQSKYLVAGLRAWPDNGDLGEPTSELGEVADASFTYGARTLAEYRAQLREFVDVSFPKRARAVLQASLDTYLWEQRNASRVAWDTEKRVWQTDKDGESRNTDEVLTWATGWAAREGWDWKLYRDQEARDWEESQLKEHGVVSQVHYLWTHLPTGILRSDMFRYLVLLLRGGIYSDTDTSLLKPPSMWGRDAKLWKDGAGWMTDGERERIAAGESAADVLGQPSVIVGVEADVGDREDWNDWWPRPLQLVQWTMASAPYHPIALAAVMRMVHQTAKAADWAASRWGEVQALRAAGDWDAADRLAETHVLKNPKDGGPIGIMNWSGPGVWTDAVLNYLRVRYGVRWVDLRGLREPLRIGDVVVLPVTGFSPGVGNFGSQLPQDAQAMVEHHFAGSWKENGLDKYR
ncbi:hypothetical protein Q8F55_003796 [Vanrija albida]|uniref:Alpha-1,6-mannosyltransferase n=1 Tax=Vanrija albida TaxID=181172 RepID=A0ABR3Q4Y6_9TREE